MLTSLIIQLKSPTEANLPATLGRAIQALLLELVGANDPAVAEAMHYGEGPKPYTVSNLILGKRRKGSLIIAAEQEGWLRFTGLTEQVSQQLQLFPICRTNFANLNTPTLQISTRPSFRRPDTRHPIAQMILRFVLLERWDIYLKTITTEAFIERRMVETPGKMCFL